MPTFLLLLEAVWQGRGFLYSGPNCVKMRASSARSEAERRPKYSSVWLRRAVRTRAERSSPAGLSCTSVARRSSGSWARMTSSLLSSWSMTSVAERGAIRRRCATSLSRRPSLVEGSRLLFARAAMARYWCGVRSNGANCATQECRRARNAR